MEDWEYLLITTMVAYLYMMLVSVGLLQLRGADMTSQRSKSGSDFYLILSTLGSRRGKTVRSRCRWGVMHVVLLHLLSITGGMY